MTTRDYAAITSLEDAQVLADRLLADEKKVGFDVETGYDGDPYPGRAVDTNHPLQFTTGFSITNNPQWARYIPLRHDNSEANLPPRETWEIFRPVLERLEVVAHHKKFEDKNLMTLHHHGDALAPIRTLPGSCTMLKAYVLARWPEMGLKYLTETLLGVKQVTLPELIASVTGKELSKPEQKKLRFNTLPVTPEVVDYGCDDAALCLELDDLFESMFEDEPNARRNMAKIESMIGHLMVDMELHGVAVDWEAMEKGYALYPSFKESMTRSVRDGFQKQAPEKDISTLNFGSAVQMRELLYEDMGLPVIRMTKGGKKSGPAPSTDKIALEGLSRVNSAVQHFLELREVEVMGTRHRKWLEENHHASDGRAHASYNQVRVPTGRFSASDPAIQQLPKKWFWSVDEVPKGTENEYRETHTNGVDYWYGNYRDYIIAAPGHYLLTYDVSQGELRVLAGLSQEPRLLEAFANGEDVHTLTAAMMLDKEPDDVEGDERQIGKALPLTERVLTPTGFAPMGELNRGDVVTTPTGTARVHDIFPQGIRQVWRVYTSDGGMTEADAEHLWETSDGLVKTEDLRTGCTIPTAVWNPPSSTHVPIDPYTMGVFIGAGTFTMADFRLSLSEPDILKALALPDTITVRTVREEKSAAGRTEYSLTTGKENFQRQEAVNPIEEALRVAGLRFERTRKKSLGVSSHAKYIPSAYMLASAADRLALLRGLMDARGSRTHSRGAEYSTYSLTLAKDIQNLVWSLGGRARISQSASAWNPVNPKRPGRSETYHIHLALEECPFKVFVKAAGWDKGLPVRRTISKVVPTNEFADMQCIALDDGKGLFVAGSYMVTHNTMNFALIYQMGTKSLADRLAIPQTKADELYANYFKQFTLVSSWIEETKRNGRVNKYAETFLGRRMPLFGYDSTNRVIRSGAERASVNYPVQGGLADIVKVSMIRSYHALKKEGLWGNGVMLTMNQHDALTFEVRNDIHPDYIRGILHAAALFDIPNFPKFVIDWELGQKWGSSVPWKLGVPVWQDEAGDWHVETEARTEAPEKAVEAPKKAKEVEPIEEVLTAPPGLRVIVPDMPTRTRMIEFMRLLHRHPGETVVTLESPSGKMDLPLKTSLTLENAAQIALVLDGAIVRVPEESATLAAIAADIDFEDA